MNTLQVLQEKRAVILQAAATHGATDVRIFGSTVRGEDRDDSDIDFLIKRTPNTTPWFPAGFILELQKILNRNVDVVIENGLNPYIRDHVLSEAKPL